MGVTTMRQIEHNFKYHPPREGQQKIYEEMRHEAKDFALFVELNCPDSREKSIALTKIEEAVMWANAAIARNK